MINVENNINFNTIVDNICDELLFDVTEAPWKCNSAVSVKYSETSWSAL